MVDSPSQVVMVLAQSVEAPAVAAAALFDGPPVTRVIPTCGCGAGKVTTGETAAGACGATGCTPAGVGVGVGLPVPGLISPGGLGLIIPPELSGVIEPG